MRFQVLEPHVLPAQFKNEDNEDNIILIILNWILIILNSELSTLFVRFQVLEPHVLAAQLRIEDNEDYIIPIILKCNPHYPQL